MSPDAPEILPQILRMLIALIIVVSLMGSLALIIRRLGLTGAITNASLTAKPTKEKRLKAIERLQLDPRRALAIVKCDDQEHLILLGATSETVIQTNIKAAPKTSATKDTNA